MRNLLVVFSALLGLAGSTAHTATYNFYFNNTEQGAKSQAAPALTVRDGVAPPGGDSPGTSTASIEEPARDEQRAFGRERRWRASVGLVKDSYTGWQIGLAHNFLPYLGANVLLGRLLGGGLELHPFRQRVGDGALNFWLQLGVSAQYPSWQQAFSGRLGNASPYYGLGLGFGFLHGLAGTVSWRARSVSPSQLRESQSLETSLAYLF